MAGFDLREHMRIPSQVASFSISGQSKKTKSIWFLKFNLANSSVLPYKP